MRRGRVLLLVVVVGSEVLLLPGLHLQQLLLLLVLVVKKVGLSSRSCSRCAAPKFPWCILRRRLHTPHMLHIVSMAPTIQPQSSYHAREHVHHCCSCVWCVPGGGGGIGAGSRCC